MAFHHSPRIVSEGLSIYYDFGNKTCYPGSGTTVTDLIQSREGTTNGPTFSSNNVGFLVLDENMWMCLYKIEKKNIVGFVNY